LEASLGYIMRPCVKQKERKERKEEKRFVYAKVMRMVSSIFF
jgi:hypothetical protein